MIQGFSGENLKEGDKWEKLSMRGTKSTRKLNEQDGDGMCELSWLKTGGGDGAF